MIMPEKAASPPAPADPEGSERQKHRTITAQDKLRILEETDRANGSGEVGAILRREVSWCQAAGDEISSAMGLGSTPWHA